MQKTILGQRYALAATVLITCLLGVTSAPQAKAQNPGWSPTIIATGQYRDQLKSMPIEQRPYRPLHFYGNSVRRNYYRGMGNSQALAPQSSAIRSNRVYSAQRPVWSGNSYPAPASPVYSYPNVPSYSVPGYNVPGYNVPTRSQYAPVQSYYAPRQNDYAPAQNWNGTSW